MNKAKHFLRSVRMCPSSNSTISCMAYIRHFFSLRELEDFGLLGITGKLAGQRLPDEPNWEYLLIFDDEPTKCRKWFIRYS